MISTARVRSLVSRLLLPLALIVAGCSDDSVTPTNPSGIPNVAGTWTGAYRVKTCSEEFIGVTGTPPATIQICPTITGDTAIRQPMTLTLQQTEDRLIGNIQFSGWFVRSLVVTGNVNRDGAVVLTGMASTTDTTCPTVQNRIVLNYWVTTLSRAQDAITGEFGMLGTRRIGTTGCVFDDVTITADTLSLTRS
jgi:hypothetical protein